MASVLPSGATLGDMGELLELHREGLPVIWPPGWSALEADRALNANGVAVRVAAFAFVSLGHGVRVGTY